ncbi:MBOAT family protein [Dyadobacter sp. CY107]|uniref:MBOAT family O-acyltransferase n=1 Tax=Dyadobacter fanqingshengii TaxID=2906443 RepID=UPI001F2C6105|nr:MBOAT family O-acyltransferase [Dyadobacter fanqingshengii]MCF2505668.1 MBOAT family protein [Dyadobacter fanqingshengii]
MLFNSLSFALFFPVVLFLYWIIARNSLRLQNIILLISSLYFYACWDYRFVFLLIFSIALDYYTGLKMGNSKNQATRKFWLVLSIAINLSFLGVLKYYNFFAESFAEGLSLLGMSVNPHTLNLVLPVGISFYTFHGLSYVIDIYKERIKPEKDLIDYAVFVSFFPLLVAGPIERATHLLPQIQKKRVFSYAQASDGLRQILWGLFKKIVIADNCAELANLAFNNHESYGGSTLLLGAFFFAMQIYGDFSGYSDIALGVARIMGIELLRNFSYPYFSRDIAEFWRRWHISLSSWFRDYVYFPLGGSRGGTWLKVRNTFIIFLLSGFWHGANWTFLAWGALNAIYFLPLLLSKSNRENLEIVAKGRLLPTVSDVFHMLITFTMTVFAWILFRAENIKHAFEYISEIFSASIFTTPELVRKDLLLLIAAFFLVEWLGREHPYAIARFGFNWPKPVKWGFYYCLVIAIFVFTGKQQQFIYFQF